MPIKRQRIRRKARTRPSRAHQPSSRTTVHTTTHVPFKAAPRPLKRAPQNQGRRARHPTACNVLLLAICRRRRRHRPNHRPIVEQGVHLGCHKQAQTMGIRRKKHRPRDAAKTRLNAITNHSTSVPVHFACTQPPQRRRRYRPGLLQRVLPPAVVLAPAVSLHCDARAQTPHAQHVNQTTAHPTQSTYPSVSHASTVQPRHCPHHHPRLLESGAPFTFTRIPEPGARRTPHDGVQRGAARNAPPSRSPAALAPTYCLTGSSLGEGKKGPDVQNTENRTEDNDGCERAIRLPRYGRRVSALFVLRFE